MARSKKGELPMKKIFAVAVLAMTMAGCVTKDEPMEGEPIVSPTVISNDKAESGEPQLPNRLPWWKTEK